jgi:hypothetical protein
MKGNIVTKSVGMAIRITENNREQIAVVNRGVVPRIEEVTTYFFFPYNYNTHCHILSEAEFLRTYEFANDENLNYFVDVNEI